MRKLLVLLLLLVFTASFFASCEYLPPEVTDVINPLLDKIGLAPTPDEPDENDELEPPHEHEFVLDESAKGKPTCSRDGKYTYVCSCGEIKEEAVKAFGHDFKVVSVTTATCTVPGSTKMKCNTCSFTTTETTPATGHNFEEFVEYSRLIPCTNEYCSYAKLEAGDGKYKEQLVYKFQDSDLDRFNTLMAEVGALLEAADAYDPALHTYVEGSELEAAYLALEEKYEEMYDIIEYVVAQYQLAQVEYHLTMKSDKEEIFNYISEVRTTIISDFYSYSQDIYDSMYRDYYYYGMTEEEIRAFIAESDTVSNPEYKAIVDRNNEIELEFLAIGDPTTSEQVPVLYAEFVANNKRLAELLGYDNYLEYAYENIYDRDYSYTDVKAISDNVKEYISPLYGAAMAKWNALAGGAFTDEQYTVYNTYINESFFTNFEANKTLNDYIDLMAFNAEKNISFSDEFNGLMSNGNLFRGQYKGAYVTSIYGADIPIAFFGNAYSSSFTVAHEFGHYMNEIYNTDGYNQSYDLLEMHSQGNELLYLAYLNSLEENDELELFETYQLLIMLDTVVNTLAVDTFEQAVYTDSYDGADSATIMADGTITSDEYDLLYKSVLTDLGIANYTSGTYWRYMTITSPCYYVSYSISAISVLQLYATALTDFDAAKDCYLKLFTYVDEFENEDDYMTTEETLRYAGMYSFTDAELYQLISRNLKNCF